MRSFDSSIGRTLKCSILTEINSNPLQMINFRFSFIFGEDEEWLGTSFIKISRWFS